MKKIIICFILSLFLVNCDISVKQSNAQTYGYDWINLNYQDYIIDNMKYRAFAAERGSGGTSLFVINLTKDALEIELLKKQLNK